MRRFDISGCGAHSLFVGAHCTEGRLIAHCVGHCTEGRLITHCVGHCTEGRLITHCVGHCAEGLLRGCSLSMLPSKLF